jgi:hypothetical protein
MNTLARETSAVSLGAALIGMLVALAMVADAWDRQGPAKNTEKEIESTTFSFDMGTTRPRISSFRYTIAPGDLLDILFQTAWPRAWTSSASASTIR